MSELSSVAKLRPSSRGFARALVLGLMCTAAAMSLPTLNLNPASHDSVVRKPILVRLIDAATPTPQPPSPVYEAEHQMSSAQLLNRWDAFITEASQRFHVPKTWIRAVMRQESGGRTVLAEDQPIVSRAGALGLMQVMPSTYDQMARVHKLGDDPFNPRANIMAGAAYLRWLHQRYGYPKMFAAYNAGPGRVDQGGRLPAETRAYVAGVTGTVRSVKAGNDLVNLTRPDGKTVQIDADKVTSVRQPLPGEYTPTVKAVVRIGHKTQAVRENVQVATAAIRATGRTI
ncbi:MAG TPA: lytic transglycosylase domain-containing protein [Rhizomicrobium sp.]|nr:lytic transglycosylase domain-containing protein [Rhizomicrobium sp.]